MRCAMSFDVFLGRQVLNQKQHTTSLWFSFILVKYIMYKPQTVAAGLTHALPTVDLDNYGS
jgi:hypothetical protein